jgi:PTH1 family peptidyl-tRNA hydrolase
MRLLAGLGNPGESYARTRHNIGFLALDALAASQGVSFSKGIGGSQVARLRIGREDVLLVKPQSFMNLSGKPIQAAMAFHKIKPADVFVIVDDVLLELGRFRARGEGSHGGHNGLRSIQEAIGTAYQRLRVGCGPCPEGWDLANYVLGRFKPDELVFLEKRLELVGPMLEKWFEEGVSSVAQLYNGPVSR